MEKATLKNMKINVIFTRGTGAGKYKLIFPGDGFEKNIVYRK